MLKKKCTHKAGQTTTGETSFSRIKNTQLRRKKRHDSAGDLLASWNGSSMLWNSGLPKLATMASLRN